MDVIERAGVVQREVGAVNEAMSSAAMSCNAIARGTTSAAAAWWAVTIEVRLALGDQRDSPGAADVAGLLRVGVDPGEELLGRAGNGVARQVATPAPDLDSRIKIGKGAEEV